VTDAEAIFKRAFWRRPENDDKLLHAVCQGGLVYNKKTLSTFRGFKEHSFECPVNLKSSNVRLPSLSMIGTGWARSLAGCFEMLMPRRM
jgi:hypothetical protein